MDLRENLVIITSKEELQKLIDEAVSKAIAGLNLTRETQIGSNSEMIHGIRELAKFLKCSTSTAQKLKNEKRVPYYEAGRVLMFRSEEVLQAISKGKKK